MMRFKKDYSLKVIFAVTSITLLFTARLYSSPSSKMLRLQIGQEGAAYPRIKKTDGSVSNLSIESLPLRNPLSKKYIIYCICKENISRSLKFHLALLKIIAKYKIQNVEVKSAGIEGKSRIFNYLDKDRVNGVCDGEIRLIPNKVMVIFMEKGDGNRISSELLEKASLILTPEVSGVLKKEDSSGNIKRQILKRFGYINGLEKRIFTPMDLLKYSKGLTIEDFEYPDYLSFKELLLIFNKEFAEKLKEVANDSSNLADSIKVHTKKASDSL